MVAPGLADTSAASALSVSLDVTPSASITSAAKTTRPKLPPAMLGLLPTA